MSIKIRPSVKVNWSIDKSSLKVFIIMICVVIATFLFTSNYYKGKIEENNVFNEEVGQVVIPIGSSI